MTLRAILALGAVLSLLVFAGCGGGGDDDGEPAVQGDAQAGATVYTNAGCGECHVFAAAGSTGTAGPNLDESAPSFDDAVDQVTDGGGGMPAFGDQLTEQQIADVAAYVSGG